MPSKLGLDELNQRISSILRERLDDVRFALLVQEHSTGLREIYASNHDHAARHLTLGSEAIRLAAEAATLLAGHQRIDEFVLVGSKERAFIFPYGKSYFVIISSEAIGDVCYHCRWDNTLLLGILPNICAAKIDTVKAIDAARSLHSITNQPISEQTSYSPELLEQLAPRSLQLSQDLDYDDLLLLSPDQGWAAARNGSPVLNESAGKAYQIAALIRSADRFADLLRSIRLGIGELQEIVISRTAARWERYFGHDRESVVMMRDQTRSMWVAVSTQDLLGRALFAMRRNFRPNAIVDDRNRPHVDDILTPWYATSESLGDRYCSGIFLRSEKLWLSSEAEPSRKNVLAAELPDVAGSVLDKFSHFSLHDDNESPAAIDEVSLEIIGSHAGENRCGHTLLVPLKADLCIFVVSGGTMDGVRRSVKKCAIAFREKWQDLSRPVTAQFVLNEDQLLVNAMTVSATVRELAPAMSFKSPVFHEELNPKARTQIEQAGLPVYLLAVGQKLSILAYVLNRSLAPWKATIKFDDAEICLSLTDRDSEGNRTLTASANLRRDALGLSRAQEPIVVGTPNEQKQVAVQQTATPPAAPRSIKVFEDLRDDKS